MRHLVLYLVAALLLLAPVAALPHRAVASDPTPVCLAGDPTGWCEVAAPAVRPKSTRLGRTSSALAGGGRTTRYVAFASISYHDREFILAFEDEGFIDHRYPFGDIDPSACTFLAHDDGAQIRFKGFCAHWNGDDFDRTLTVWDSGWAYYGP